MNALYTAAESSGITGVTEIEDLFSDYIHPNTLGNYYEALAIFAEIYGVSVDGATYTITYENGDPISGLPTATQAAQLKAIVDTESGF